MTRCKLLDFRTRSVIYGLLILVPARGQALGEPTPAATSAFNSYVDAVELRLGGQHRSKGAFLTSVAPALQSEIRLRGGELIIEELTPSSGAALPGALLHHWRGTAFAPRATAADFERLMRDFSAYPQHFFPQVLQARVLAQKDGRVQALMRVRQRHVITVVMDTSYDVTFGRLDGQHGYSVSRSTRISEIDSPGSGTERVLGSNEEHGFLWRLNTYWSYEERDGGLYVQIESVSLTRPIPRGLGWAVQPFVESIPRESLEFTLRSTCNAIRRSLDGGTK
jgi:hypothetical protein